MSAWTEQRTAAEFRDVVKGLVDTRVEELVGKRYRRATVESYDRDEGTATVVFNGETDNPVSVQLHAIQPVEVGQEVLINGTPGNKYIADVLGDPYIPSVTPNLVPDDGLDPATPTGLTAYPAVEAANLIWDTNTEVDMVVPWGTYRLEFSYDDFATPPAFTFEVLNTFFFAPLPSGNTYYLRVTAIDVHGNVSAPSASVAVDPLPFPGSAGIPIVTPLPTLPDPDYPEGFVVVFEDDGALYINEADVWELVVPVVPPSFGLEIVGTLPTLPDGDYPNDYVVVLSTNGFLYRNASGAWVPVVRAPDLQGQIITAQIAADAVTAAELAANAVDTAAIQAAAVTGTNIAATTITAANIAAGTVTATQIAAATILGSNIAATTIAAGNIVSGTITTTQIAVDTILAGNIAANAITSSELAANSVIAGKILAGTIVTTDIAADTILAGNIAANAITSSELAANAVIAGKIDAGAVTAGTIAANAVTSGTVVAGSITTLEIAANTIQAGDIAANTISTHELNVSMALEVGQLLKSSSYVAGTSGWQIKADGSADFSGTLLVGGATTLKGDLTVGSGGAGLIQSQNYNGTTPPTGTATAGWMISQNGVVEFASTLYIGGATTIAGATTLKAALTVGSAGVGSVKSQNYNGATPPTGTATAGWIIDQAGAVEFAGSMFVGGTATIKGSLVVGSGSAGILKSSTYNGGFPVNGTATAGWGMDYTGAVDFSNSVYVGGTMVVMGNITVGSGSTGEIKSSNYVASTSGWRIRYDGSAEFSGSVLVKGTITVGPTTGDIQSSNFITLTTGWRIRHDGTAEFASITIRGKLLPNQITIQESANILSAANSTYEAAGTTWSNQGVANTTVARDVSNPHGGTASLKMATTVGTAVLQPALNLTNPTPTADQMYRWSFWAKFLLAENTLWTVIAIDGATPQTLRWGQNIVGTGAYVEYEYFPTVTAGNNLTLGMGIEAIDGAVSSIYFDDMSLTPIGGVTNLLSAKYLAVQSEPLKPSHVGSLEYNDGRYAPAPDVQIFIPGGSSTWTKPEGNYQMVAVTLIGSGGGGGSGRKGATSTIRGGGGGGGGGAMSFASFPISALGATEAVSVSAGGTGSAGRTTSDTGGANGIAGSPSTFGTTTIMLAAGGGAGTGGTTAVAGGTGGARGGLGTDPGGIGGDGGSAGANVGGFANTMGRGATGGGGGGSVSAGNVNSAGFAGGDQQLRALAGGAAGAAGGAGGAGGGTTNIPMGGTGGGGGGGRQAAGTGATIAGGAGGSYGGGGGGGGGGTNTTADSGNGGNGGPGYAIVVTT